MQPLSAVLIQAKNKVDSGDPWVMTVAVSKPTDPVTWDYLVNDTDPVTYQGQEYTPFPMKLSAIANESKGNTPSVTLQFGNPQRVFYDYLDQYDAMVDQIVIIRWVNRNALGEDYSNLTIVLDVIGAQDDPQWATFQLGPPRSLRRRHPLHAYIAGHCRWKVNSIECGLVGATCDRTFKGCEANNNLEHFGGEVGLGGGIRIV